jgi:hypothetical protein
MTENQFVMVSGWMIKGNINEFVKADANADRLELVCSRPTSPYLDIDDRVIIVAERRHQGVNLYARQGNSAW